MSQESTWYREYILNTSVKTFSVGSRKANKFRRRFRLKNNGRNSWDRTSSPTMKYVAAVG